ncbi:SOS response-associated peptidase family protein [Novosphingobium sp.]|uniref:SOS response-associated peptidase n=1 Tax=Novosphingobium sp. TaxID=1874826 RepID=UPI00334103BB
MCNLYRLHAGPAVIAQLFDVVAGIDGNRGDEVYPGYPGLVVADGVARTMTWGFPLVLKGRQGQPLKPKSVTNAREDKLHSAFWRASFATRRCLIPVSAWAEAEGTARAMTRTWYALPGDAPFAVAGLWRPSDTWGDVYAMVMVAASPQMADVHDRMPVIVAREAWATWLHGESDAAFALCQTYGGELAVDRTADRWAGGTVRQPGLFEAG